MNRVFPRFESDVDDEDILAAYSVDNRAATHFRMNFVSTLDGAASADGHTAALGGEGDKRVFDLLRRLSDVVVVAAGTVRIEKYGPMRLGDESTEWRKRHSLAPHPVFAIVSGTLDLDPATRVFTDAPVRPLVLTVATAPGDKRAALAEVADVVDCGVGAFDPLAMMRFLRERGLNQVHGEGGPSLFGTFIAADVIDELCLTLSPELAAGSAPRIAHGESADELRAMTLTSLMQQDSVLFARYLRDCAASRR